MSGSGMDAGPLLDEVLWERPFASFPQLHPAGIKGHEGRFLFGRCGTRRVILQSGRLHVYEGLDFEAVTRPMGILREFGVDTAVLLNAAGGLCPELRPGDLVAVSSVRCWPYPGWENTPDTLTPNVLVPGCAVTGEYIWMHGPSYETRAEIRALQSLGGMVIGMSAAPELERAQSLGIRTAVLSCVTNSCCAARLLTHREVLETARRSSKGIIRVLRDAIRTL
ncbi:MAG: hypothetical protein HY706_19200 [Candidatus Hydrogenedentes bacterium]|nr:hypothetical protein [Candidatus Hydrogenedentota bacterium]